VTSGDSFSSAVPVEVKVCPATREPCENEDFEMHWLLATVVLLTTALALADHGVPATARGGFGWTTWLLIAGAVAAVGLAAWAFFGPDRPEERRRPTAADPPEPPAR
jgi:hypothetical protein